MLPCEAGGRNEFISKFLSIKKSPPDFDILTCAVDAGARGAHHRFIVHDMAE